MPESSTVGVVVVVVLVMLVVLPVLVVAVVCGTAAVGMVGRVVGPDDASPMQLVSAIVMASSPMVRACICGSYLWWSTH